MDRDSYRLLIPFCLVSHLDKVIDCWKEVGVSELHASELATLVM